MTAEAYVPRGRVADLFACQAPEVLLSGPAGTGKSIACLWKLHLLATYCPGFRGLIARKTRESLSESALVTFESKVLTPNHPALGNTRLRRVRQSYAYPNGSEIVVGGLDRPSKIMSTEFDAAYVQEAIELLEGDWEAITTRLRNGRLPYQQLLADTNPDRPTHWLRNRCDAGRTLDIPTRHQDNPALWDAARDAWTPQGAAYIAKLDALTGPRKQRLRHGRWVQAEGVVYDGWDAAVHVVDRFAIPADWPRYWAVDFGFVDPFVCLWFALSPDGRLYLYRQHVQAGRLVEDHAKLMLFLSEGEPKPRAIVCDHDREGRATLEKYLGMRTVAAEKAIESGIQAVAARLLPSPPDGGTPRLLVLRGSLHRRDPALDERKAPIGVEEEIDGYVWREDAARKRGEEPVDRDNHALDAARYLVAHLDLKPKRELRLR